MRRAALLALVALGACAHLEQAPAPVVQVPEPPPEVAAPGEPVPAEPVPAEPVPAPAPVPAPPQAIAVEPEENRQAAELLGYTQRVAQMGAEEQRRELAAVTQAATRDRTNYSRVKLGLLYALPGAAIQDDTRALATLEPVAGGSGALKQLAGLVHAQVSDRVKTHKRAEQYREQLEALKAVERSIIERGQQTQPRKP